MKTLARKRSSLKSEARALSLQVIQCEVNEDEPVPLKMYDPNWSPEKCIRRSARFTTNKYRRSPTEQSAESWDPKSAPALHPGDLVKCMRRSPRLAGVNDGRELNLEKPDCALDSNLIEWRDSSEKRRSSEVNAVNSGVREVGEKCLRSRLVPARVYECSSRDSLNEPPSKKVKTLSARADVIRRSPRFSSPSVGAEKSNANEKSPSSLKRSSETTTTNLGKTDSHVLGEKCLRSRTVPVLLIGSEENVDPKYSLSDRKTRGKARSCDSLLALPAPPPSSAKQSSKRPKTTLGKTDSNFLVGKCLRSRTVPVPLGGSEEDVESKSAFVDLADVSADRKPMEKIKNALGDIVSDVSGQSLRSRITPFRLVETEDVETAVIELPNVFGDGKQTEKMNAAFGGFDLDDGMVEKCLRSRKVPFFVARTENGDTKPAVVTSPDVSGARTRQQKIKALALSKTKEKNKKSTGSFVGEPVPDEEARERWRWRYELKSQRSKCQIGKLNADEEDEIILNVECHYTKAKVDCCIFNLGDCAYIKGNGRQKHIGRILEFFKTTDGENYFRVQWFFRAEDTVMKNEAAFHDKKRLFYSNLMNDNLLDCIVSKVTVTRVAPTLGLQWLNFLPPSDFYYDMEYCVEYSTFRTLLTDNSVERHELYTPDDNATCLEDMPRSEPYKAEWALLDLYSGCGGMSTGLCLGAKLSSVNLVTRWAVDADRSACDSLKLNHPETQVRNQAAEDFLELLKGWEKLCQQYVFNNLDKTPKFRAEDTREVKSKVKSPSAGEYEVLSLVDICFGDPSNTGEHGLKFKVRWKGYSSSEDTWEPIEELSNCQERIQDFVRSGLKSKILPLPGDVDVLCGGPPCQGISGYNRFRNTDAPLTDERNHQIVVFMDIVKFLRPKYVLMENVVDIIKFDKASLARYALSRLVHMKYQARLGTIAAGCYGLPQFRLRVFLWGALPSESLPQFPLPTHDVVVKYWPPLEFERNTVAYDEGEPRELEKAIILHDAISDLPAVTNHDIRQQRTYETPPETEFQRYIRLTKDEMMGLAAGVVDAKKPILYDHRTFKLSENNYLRVCQIPHKKGANFRDLPGVVVGDDNVASWDSTKEPVMLPSGKPLVPDCVFTYEQGKSKRPYARLWWDETVSTVVTFPNVRSQAVLHPEQDRVLTIREFARLQGFPDFYRFCGTIKERYCQVGNAVAVPVGRALGYTLGRAIRKLGGDEPLMTLPPKFAFQQHPMTG